MRWIQLPIIGLLLCCISSCDFMRPKTELERVLSKGTLVVLTRNGATTYYEGPDGKPVGFEYELASRFADHLGVKLKMVVPASLTDILYQIKHGRADLAAAGLTVTDEREKHVRFGPRYHRITQQLVYRRGAAAPAKIEDIIGGELLVVAGSSHVERLRELKQKHPELTWEETKEMENEELLTAVWEEQIEYTVADSNEVALTHRYYPELEIAFDLTEEQPLAWAFPISTDDSLYSEAVKFFNDLIDTGELERLVDRYYGHIDDFDYVGTRNFMLHIQTRLPRYQQLFQQAAEATGLDWRLLAAIGYQESHWNPNAISPTGVRGIMMLTLDTARHLGISNRLDPAQSIEAAARYMRDIRNRIPERIEEPDRTWLALAAYNIGTGHLEDARRITQRQGYDPDLWIHVKEHLPLLRKMKWYSTTKHGYARGHEAVHYVDNVRNYYDLLVRISERTDLYEFFPRDIIPYHDADDTGNLQRAI
ncbi:MAG: membrane-bound lytic murein transglycosylase MltF [Pseudomonadota bacterium]